MSRDKHQQKKFDQLGMNPSTASARLVKDILWNFIVKTNQDICYKCGHKMCRNTFSIEHKTPWLDSENPIDQYFNLENISFTHLVCNISDARKPHSKNRTDEEIRQRNIDKSQRYRDTTPKDLLKERRRKNYVDNGN